MTNINEDLEGMDIIYTGYKYISCSHGIVIYKLLSSEDNFSSSNSYCEGTDHLTAHSGTRSPVINF